LLEETFRIDKKFIYGVMLRWKDFATNYYNSDILEDDVILLRYGMLNRVGDTLEKWEMNGRYMSSIIF